MKIQIEREIPADAIASLMISAIESGDPVTRGWCAGIHLKQHEKALEDPIWYADEELYNGKFQVEIFEIADEGVPYDIATGANLITHLKNEADFVIGFQQMAKLFPKQFRDIINDNADAACADLFLQAMLFNDERYA